MRIDKTLKRHLLHVESEVEVCQTQPIKMTWCPLRLLLVDVATPEGCVSKGRTKWMSTASPVTTTLLIRHWAMACRSSNESWARFVAQQLAKGRGIVDDLLPMDALLPCVG